MAPAASASLKPMPLRSRKPLLAAAPLFAAAVVVTTGGLSPVAPGFIATSSAGVWATGPSRFAGGSFEAAEADSDIIRRATYPQVKPPSHNYREPQYDGYVYRRKTRAGIRLRLDRFGSVNWPFYRIKAAFGRSRPNRSARFLESLGWYDPMREVDHPRFFKLKADRAVYWLRSGAQPTDMVASLLDRAGIIRRTGPDSKSGEWEWRIPKLSGPDPPEGWSYDGNHEITWNNQPYIHHRKGHPFSKKKIMKTALIERYGFTGYEKIPIEGDVLTEPVAGNSLLHGLDNTELPIFWKGARR